MDLALNNLQGLICHKTQQTHQPCRAGNTIKSIKYVSKQEQRQAHQQTHIYTLAHI